MLKELGVVEKVIEQGIVCPIWQYRDAQEGVERNGTSVLENDTDYPYRVQCEQFKLTRIIVSDKMDNVEVLFDVKGTVRPKMKIAYRYSLKHQMVPEPLENI